MNPQRMTPVRACQVASELLKNNADASDTMHGVLNEERVAAIQVLRDTTAKVIVHGLQRR
jgi:hypothetical protein